MPDIEAILQSDGFKVVSVLQQSKNKKVLLTLAKDGSKTVVKSFGEKNRFIEREIDFLKEVSDVKFSFLVFPKLIGRKQNYFLTEFVEREYLTRDTVTKLIWTDQNFTSFIEGLLEFQRVKRSKKYFTLIEIIKGFFFPAFIIFKNYRRIDGVFTFIEKLKILRLAFYYLLSALFVRKVSVHYDLQTTNYTFIRSSEKMSMLDMETGPYNGDEWYDLLYYCSIPVMKLEDWTFQKTLFVNFVKAASRPAKSGIPVKRIRSILTAIQIIRYLNFINESDKREVYFNNLRQVLLNGKKFETWFHSLIDA